MTTDNVVPKLLGLSRRKLRYRDEPDYVPEAPTRPTGSMQYHNETRPLRDVQESYRDHVEEHADKLATSQVYANPKAFAKPKPTQGKVRAK